MATNILAAVRQCPRLRGNLKFTAIEIGHLMNTQGYGRVAYAFMASKTGYSRRTAIRHMHRLVAMRIFAKTVYKLKNGYAINLYKCLLAVPAFYRDRAQRASGDNMSSSLPEDRGEAKELALGEEIDRLKKGLRFLSNPDTPMYQACVEKIAALEGLRLAV